MFKAEARLSSPRPARRGGGGRKNGAASAAPFPLFLSLPPRRQALSRPCSTSHSRATSLGSRLFTSTS